MVSGCSVGIDYNAAPGEVQTVSGSPVGDDPLFDAAIVYAPIFGRNVYAGIRWAFGRGASISPTSRP